VQGHLEDIAIAKDYHGMKFGMKLINALDHIAAQLGCYKVCALARSVME
jgi:glucosamine-phosphate N-acetyltransferase